MALSYVTDAGTLIIPGSYSTIKVENSASGLSTTGIVFLVGEADAGPDYSLEEDLNNNLYGPDQVADVVAKYKTGNLVDAFRVSAAPANDPDILGAPNRFCLVKTNASTKAQGDLDAIGGGTYGTIFDKSYGDLGNLIYYTIEAKTAEVVPTTSAFTYIPGVDTVDISFRANGGDEQIINLTANHQPDIFVSAVNGLDDIDANGGGDRGTLVAAGNNLAVSVALNVVTISRDDAWDVKPTVGDTLTIPVKSVIGGDRSSLDTGDFADNLDTVLALAQSGVGGDDVELITVADGAGAGSIGVVGNVITFHYQSTVTTVADFESNFPLSTTYGDVVIETAGTQLSTLVAVDDAIDENFSGGTDENVGAYVVTASTVNTITATKLSDAGAPAPTVGVITAPVVISSITELDNSDLTCWEPATIKLAAADQIAGLGKTLEINQLTTGNDLLERLAFVLGTTTAVGWVSKEGAAKLLTSASEYAVKLNINRQLDNVQESVSAGGLIALKLGYMGDTCDVVVTATSLTTTVTGGDGDDLSIDLTKFPTLADLASFINSKVGYACAIGTTTIGSFSPLGLDEGTFTAGTTWGNYTMRLKCDAVKFFKAISDNSVLVQFGNPAVTATAGLPDVMSDITYLSGGAKGGTSNENYIAAIDGIEVVKGNFVVPLFSRDASEDITDGLTDSSSSYDVATVQAYAKTHALKMSTLKRRKNRQAFVSNRGTFLAAQEAAQNLASARVALTFQDVKAVGSHGVTQYQPWMLAALAAGMQAAAFYRALVHKGINCSGVLQAAGDFKDSDDTNLEDGLLAGLLIAQKSDSGGFMWVSDQTTYSKDNNFVFNSVQAMYVADVIALTASQRMEKAFVGQSVADISAGVALAAFQSIMAQFKKLKLIAASDDAPDGFKNATIKIQGPAMVVSVEIKLAGAIYFIPINILVSQVSQSAG